ncbi:MAG TPA: hypothetical protein VKG62_05515 [Solirubrobacteraceae bacterium]|nr:hypothetical protein [Solirubrobacteraceae bacterium]
MERSHRNPAIALSRRMARPGAAGALAVLAVALLGPGTAAASGGSFLASHHRVASIGSTVPANGDQNPYGIADVTQTVGSLRAGDVLVSNFNDVGSPPTGNLQGTGTTIVQMTPSGRLSLFARIAPASLPGSCPGGVGLTTALATLPGGFVVVGSLPTADGTAATAQPGCLIVLDSDGQPVETIAGSAIDGPWDMTAVAEGADATLFVTNVLRGTVASGETPVDEGTVVRIRMHVREGHLPQVTGISVIAGGFPERTDPAALVVGPTGVALGEDGTLYVADTQGNRIAAVTDALSRSTPLQGGGRTVASGGYLEDPLGLTLAPNGDILTSDAGDGNIVETTPSGAEFPPLDTGAGAGGLFGLTVAPDLRQVFFVDDTDNTLGVLR